MGRVPFFRWGYLVTKTHNRGNPWNCQTTKGEPQYNEIPIKKRDLRVSEIFLNIFLVTFKYKTYLERPKSPFIYCYFIWINWNEKLGYPECFRITFERWNSWEIQEWSLCFCERYGQQKRSKGFKEKNRF